MIVSLVAAMGRDNVIGRQGGLPWGFQDVPGEPALFRATTLDKPVIMGRKTWESLPNPPLRRRTNCILTRQPDWEPDWSKITNKLAHLVPAEDADETPIIVCNDLPALLSQLTRAGHDEACVIGGAEVFNQAYALADRVYLTLVMGDHRGDVYFPTDVLGDDCWDWDPELKQGRGWTRYILNKRLDYRPGGTNGV
jgi:dihydrofolate reductase